MSVWEPIHGFTSPGEFERFERWLDDRIADGAAEELDVAEPYGSPYFTERWVREVASGEVWRVVAPEPPFTGVFLPVDRSDA